MAAPASVPAPPPRLFELIQKFTEHREAYLRPEYKEAQLRKEFIDPLLEILGWDVANAAGYAEAYKEVIHEDAIRIGGTTKAPDYCLRIGGVRKFFVEAKKPSVKIKDDAEAALQLRRYGWNQKLPLSILTNFAELAIYDTRIKPGKDDNAGKARVRYFALSDLAKRWDVLYGTFSKEAILKGWFDKYAATEKDKKGTVEVDEAFLKDIESWREELAKNLAIRNGTVTQAELNFAVQAIIDRIIFLRICEDRGLETYGRLKNLLEGSNTYKRLNDIFTLADQRYNSGLFYFDQEKARHGAPDLLTPALAVDDKVLKDILRNLYYPDSAYEFSVLPADILGQVYEQFLGKVIRLTDAHRAKVEEKPEVKKAGGVYYTPTHIVDYIVRHTLAPMLRTRTPATMQGFRVVDPACGSGSFLIVAYQYLLDWYRDQYVLDGPKKHKKEIIEGPGGSYLLTPEARKRILLDHIFGVDLDPQAVETTKLSLLLKVLEKTSGETIERNQKLFHERALPDIDGNVKCGNSLIASDALAGRPFADDSGYARAFDWEKEFPAVFAEGGFTAVIGNPPYVRIQTTTGPDTDYLNRTYASATGNYDIYCLFVEKGYQLLRPGGRLGFIVPHRFLKNDYGAGLRGFLAKEAAVRHVLDFDGYMVFDTASINTCILVLNKERREKLWHVQAPFVDEPSAIVRRWLTAIREGSLAGETGLAGWVPHARLEAGPWIFVREEEASLWAKLQQVQTNLGDVSTNIFQGLKTSADGIFIGEVASETGLEVELKFPDWPSAVKLEKGITRSLIKGGQMRRFVIEPTKRRILFPYQDGAIIPPEALQRDFPLAWNYLKSRKTELEAREGGELKVPQWYAYGRSQALTTMANPKIVTPDYYAHASFGWDASGEQFFCGGGAGGYGILLKEGIDPLFVLGILNSRLADWYVRKITIRAYQTAFMYVRKYIEPIPIKLPSGESEIKLAQKVVDLAMAVIKAKQSAARTPDEQRQRSKKIGAIMSELDAAVFELYGLSPQERELVMAAVPGVETL